MAFEQAHAGSEDTFQSTCYQLAIVSLHVCKEALLHMHANYTNATSMVCMRSRLHADKALRVGTSQVAVVKQLVAAALY